MGLQMAFVGVFGAVLQPVTSSIIAESGWRIGYYFVGLLTFAAVILSALLLLRNRPEERGIMPYGYGIDKDLENNPDSVNMSVEISEKVAVRSISFYLLLLFMIAITGVGVFMQHIPTYGGIMGYSLKEVGSALSFASIGSAIGSIAIGMISDKIGSLKTCYGIIIIGIIAIIGFIFSSSGFIVFGVSTFLHGLVSSGIMVLAPILALNFFGQKDYEKIYAKVAMGAPLASIFLIPTYGFIYDRLQDYFPVLIVMLILLVLAGLCIAVGWRYRCTTEGCPTWGKK